ncbi:nitroreductase family protein [bacterium]|nr:nitroreductase family protein [bacterium]
MENVIFRRRSIRRFFDKPVEQEKLERILRAGMQAPSAHNNQRWEFIVITEQDKKDAVSKMSPWAGMVANAPVSIVVLGKHNDEELNKWFAQDLGACTENILLQIAEEGLGGCWMGFYPDMDRVQMLKDFFNVPDGVIPFCVISLGYSPDENRYVDRADVSKIHYNKY